MHEICVVWVVESLVIDHGNIVVDDQVDFRHIDSSCQNIGGNQCGEDALTELIDNRIALSVFESSNQNFSLDPLRKQLFLELCCTFLLVDKDHRHGSLQIGVQLCDEVNFLSFLLEQLEILNAFQLERFFGNVKGLESSHKLRCFAHNVIIVSRRVQTVLRVLIDFLKVLLEHFEAVMIRVLDE